MNQKTYFTPTFNLFLFFLGITLCLTPETTMGKASMENTTIHQLNLYSFFDGSTLGKLTIEKKTSGEHLVQIRLDTVDKIKHKDTLYSLEKTIKKLQDSEKVGILYVNPRHKVKEGTSHSKYSSIGDSNFLEYLLFDLLDDNVYVDTNNYTDTSAKLVKGIQFTTNDSESKDQSWSFNGGILIWKSSDGSFKADPVVSPDGTLYSTASLSIEPMAEKL